MNNDAPLPPARLPRGNSPWVNLAAVALLALYAVMALAASIRKGPAFDESAQLAAGYNIWEQHDFRLLGANGDFLKRWATLPFLISHPHPVPADSPETQSGSANELGFRFFFQSDNHPELLLLQSRAMVVLLGVALGWLIFVCARAISGPVGALAALVIYTFSPNMLAFSAMVTTEIPLCLALLGSTWCLWRLLNRVTWGWLVLSLGFLVMLTLSRPSALVIFPIALLLLLARFFSNRPLDWRLGRPRIISSRATRMGMAAGLAVLHGVVAWAAVWANYDFRYAAVPNAHLLTAAGSPSASLAPDTGSAFLDWARKAHFLPEGFLNGAQVLLDTRDVRQNFLDGDWAVHGWSGFLLSVAWEKTSPALLAILGIGLWGWGNSLLGAWQARRKDTAATPTSNPINHYESIPFLILTVVYFSLVAAQTLNFGQRSVLPGFPALYILGGAGAAWVWSQRAKWVRALLVVLLLWRTVEAVVIYPNYLAYFNPFVGGPAEGYQHLVDKSLDWGMDLPSLKTFLDRADPNHTQPVYLAYFGTDDPAHYGIDAERLPGYPDWRKHKYYSLQPGYYAISATLHQTLYTSTFGPWNVAYEEEYQDCLRQLQEFDRTENDTAARRALIAQHPPNYYENLYAKFEKLRLGRLTSWLRHHKPPDASAGYSILIWKLNADEIGAALLFPPSELAEHPM